MFHCSEAVVVRKKTVFDRFSKVLGREDGRMGFGVCSAGCVWCYSLSSDFSGNLLCFHFVYPGLPRSEWT